MDTPGHNDFGEDTYRVLTSVDSAVMVIDAAKGIETQTKKLFQVCRMRGIPIFTFMNKLDRQAKDPLELMEELEEVLGMPSVAITWPIGSGMQFEGVYDRMKNEVHLFRGEKSTLQLSEDGVNDPILAEHLSEENLTNLRDEIDLLDADTLDQLFDQTHFDLVIHFAGLKAVGESVQQPLRYYHNNITGTLNLLQSMQAHDVKKLISPPPPPFTATKASNNASNPCPPASSSPTLTAKPNT